MKYTLVWSPIIRVDIHKFLGLKRFPAGRIGEAPSHGLSASLNSAGFKLSRLQTGTPARLDASTINFEGLYVQEGDQEPVPFSFLNRTVDNAVGLLHAFLCLLTLGRITKFLVIKHSQQQPPIKWCAITST